MDEVLIQKIRLDSLSKHDGATKKYGTLPLDSCVQIIVNRGFEDGVIQIVFEEMDGWGHGLKVPDDWILEDHISTARKPCPRCGGAGKLTLHGIDCTECVGTGRIAIPKDLH